MYRVVTSGTSCFNGSYSEMEPLRDQVVCDFIHVGVGNVVPLLRDFSKHISWTTDKIARRKWKAIKAPHPSTVALAEFERGFSISYPELRICPNMPTSENTATVRNTQLNPDVAPHSKQKSVGSCSSWLGRGLSGSVRFLFFCIAFLPVMRHNQMTGQIL